MSTVRVASRPAPLEESSYFDCQSQVTSSVGAWPSGVMTGAVVSSMVTSTSASALFEAAVLGLDGGVGLVAHLDERLWPSDSSKRVRISWRSKILSTVPLRWRGSGHRNFLACCRNFFCLLQAVPASIACWMPATAGACYSSRHKDC